MTDAGFFSPLVTVIVTMRVNGERFYASKVVDPVVWDHLPFQEALIHDLKAEALRYVGERIHWRIEVADPRK